MKPKNIAFVTTFDSYEDAEAHWNKLKNKEIYGIGQAGSKYFIIKKAAIDVVFEENEQEPVAWRLPNMSIKGEWVYRDLDDPFIGISGDNVGEPLYTAPQTISDDEVIERYRELARKGY